MEDMFITPLQPWHLTETGSVDKTEDTLAKNQYLLATGQIEDPHTVGIASSEAQLASDMLVSLRNKALEAYNEIMRINL